MTRFKNPKLLQTIVFTAFFSTLVTPAIAQQITTDGYTATTLTRSGNKTTITTDTVKGNNAFNSFKTFNVHKGNVVDLIVPGQASNLINIIKDEATTINGTLNAIKNGQIGGNVFLVNPYGIVIGESGVANVGSLTNITPTKDFVDNFFDSPGNPNKDAVIAVLEGKTPNNPEAEVIIKGIIHEAQAGILDEDVRPKADIKDIVNLEEIEEMKELIVSGEEAFDEKIAGSGPIPPIPMKENMDSRKIVTTGPVNPVAKEGLDPGPGPIINDKPVGDIDPEPDGPIIKENPNNKLSVGGILPPIPNKIQELQEKPNDKLSDGGVLPPLPFKGIQENPNNKLSDSVVGPPIPLKELQENPNNKLSDGGILPPVPLKVQELQENPNNKLSNGGILPPIPVKENDKVSGNIPLPPIPEKSMKEIQENPNNKLSDGGIMPPVPAKTQEMQADSKTQPPVASKYTKLMLTPVKSMVVYPAKAKVSEVKDIKNAQFTMAHRKVKAVAKARYKINDTVENIDKPLPQKVTAKAQKAIYTHNLSIGKGMKRKAVRHSAAYHAENIKENIYDLTKTKTQSVALNPEAPVVKAATKAASKLK